MFWKGGGLVVVNWKLDSKKKERILQVWMLSVTQRHRCLFQQNKRTQTQVKVKILRSATQHSSKGIDTVKKPHRERNEDITQDSQERTPRSRWKRPQESLAVMGRVCRLCLKREMLTRSHGQRGLCLFDCSPQSDRKWKLELPQLLVLGQKERILTRSLTILKLRILGDKKFMMAMTHSWRKPVGFPLAPDLGTGLTVNVSLNHWPPEMKRQVQQFYSQLKGPLEHSNRELGFSAQLKTQ